MALARPVEARRSDEDRTRQTAIAIARFVCQHWLAVANVSLVIFSLLPVLAPILAALGADGVALVIFQAYSLTCHQLPERSYFLFGHQMAYCERNTAIYFATTGAGLAYVRLRARGLGPLPIRWYLVLILSMALDGFTQLFGWRESTWLLRGITGSLFAAATVWFTFPRLEESFVEMEREL